MFKTERFAEICTCDGRSRRYVCLFICLFVCLFCITIRTMYHKEKNGVQISIMFPSFMLVFVFSSLFFFRGEGDFERSLRAERAVLVPAALLARTRGCSDFSNCY